MMRSRKTTPKFVSMLVVMYVNYMSAVHLLTHAKVGGEALGVLPRKMTRGEKWEDGRKQL